jgi:hypothetical protein
MSRSRSESVASAQDLSYDDQQELLAFIEKRNWFEQKLDVSVPCRSALLSDQTGGRGA